MKNRGLATRLIFFILLSAALIFLAALLYNYQASKATVLEEIQSNARNLAQATAYKIGLILQGAEKVPRTLARTLTLQPLDLEEIKNLIQAAVADNPELFGVCAAFAPRAFDPRKYYLAPYAFRKDGQIKVEVLGSEDYRYFNADWYQIPVELGRPVWAEPYFDEGGGNIIMSTFSVPCYRDALQGRELLGVVTCDISLLGLKDLVAGVKIYQTGYAFLISHNGVFVTHPEPHLIMRESIFSVAEAENDLNLRRLGQEMVRGGEGFVPLEDFSTGKKAWLYYTPLPALDWSLGVVIPEDELLAQVYLLSRKLMLIALVGLAFLSLVIVTFARTVTRPLRRLTQAAAAIGHGDFAVTVPEKGGKEIVQLAHSFNQLGQQLTEYMEKRDFIRDTFGRYVTMEVVKKLLEDESALELGGETREVSILMSDIRGFTALTVDMDPEKVIIFLNRYLGKMIEILVDYRAVIDEIVGDGILAFFGAPELQEDHAVRAVACALEMQAAMEEINRLNLADSLPHLEMGVAVNTGQVVVGNIGSEKRTKYSVVGAHVNFTSRIESYALGGQVLISQSTYQEVKDFVEVRDTLKAEMKGVPEPVTLYEVGGMRGPYNITLPEKMDILMPLPERLPIHLYRIQEKIVAGAIMEAWITSWCETGASVGYEGKLAVWEDVKIHLLDERGQEEPGKIFGKVTAVQATSDGGQEAAVRFTSVPPEIAQRIREMVREE